MYIYICVHRCIYIFIYIYNYLHYIYIYTYISPLQLPPEELHAMKGPASPSERTSLVPDALLDLEATFFFGKEKMRFSHRGSPYHPVVMTIGSCGDLGIS